ncbi:MAG: substrate-binding domain-containing protein [Xanthomonadales bacterium]|nr:substrate-binding domain-containing protein [Xanthomonadales bacterium]
MRVATLLLTAASALLAAAPVHAQLSLRGDYAAARGLTEVGALYARQTRTSLTVTPFSTNAGIEGVIRGEIDIATSARPPVPGRDAERHLVFWPVAWDAVVFIVHPSNPVRELSLAQVRDIFMGRLENWNQVGGRDAPIDLYSVMGPYDGLESSMRQILFGNPGYNAKIRRLFLNQHQIEIGVQMDPDSIGMTTLAGLDKQRVRALGIEGVAADKDTVADGRYLLTVPLYLVYRADNPKVDEINRFAEFLRTPVAENVIVGKRLVPHRDDQDFRDLHARRLTTLWERLGGEPLPVEQVRFAGRDAAQAADAGDDAGEATAATAALASVDGIEGDADAAAGAEAVAEAAAPAVPNGSGQTAAEGTAEAGAECRRTLFSRKC